MHLKVQCEIYGYFEEEAAKSSGYILDTALTLSPFLPPSPEQASELHSSGKQQQSSSRAATEPILLIFCIFFYLTALNFFFSFLPLVDKKWCFIVYGCGL